MSKNLFNSVKLVRPNSNIFDLSHDVKLTCNMGELVPVCIIETVPGDRYRLSVEALVRFMPLVAPMMHRVDVSIHYFYVPNRLLWDNWQSWITDTKIGSPAAVPVHPYIKHSQITNIWGKMLDYYGIPDIVGSNDFNLDALSFAAYQKVFNDYYRDENLVTNYWKQEENPIVDGDNTSNTELYELRRRAWEHDYFTSALPWAQKGDAVDIPLGDVRLKDIPWGGLTPPYPTFRNLAGDDSATGDLSMETDGLGGSQIESAGEPGIPRAYDPAGSLTVDSTTINDLRRAYKLQEWLEKNALGGTRNNETDLVHFGVRSQDSRLQRAEYIVGIKQPVVISEVLNTTGTTELPQGNMAGHGISVVNGNYGGFYAPERGWLIGIMSVMPKTAYQQGIPRKFLNINHSTEKYWPTFDHIGEQAVLKEELYIETADPGGTFGYEPRYVEYKSEFNRVAGQMRTTMNHWHMGRIFESEPVLDGSFVTSNPTNRVFAVTSEEEDKLVCQVFNKISAVRLMSKYSTPGI